MNELVDLVRARTPLVHCITASVSANLVANTLLAASARPMMTQTRAEAPALVAIADALLVNLGVLSVEALDAIPPTVAAARSAGKPWVLDPAGVGAAPVRTPLAQRLLSERPAVVRANASEVLVLAGHGSGGRGADSVDTTDDALDAARDLARRHDTVVALSGAVDVITDGERVAKVAAGHQLLTRVTGTGCSLGGLVAACCGVGEPFEAAVTATAWLGVAGERAAGSAAGPGTFAVHLLDALASLTPDEIGSRTVAHWGP